MTEVWLLGIGLMIGWGLFCWSAVQLFKPWWEDQERRRKALRRRQDDRGTKAIHRAR